MIGRSGLPTALFILPICAALAIFIGYLMATPFTFGSSAVLSLTFAVLVVPILLRWHHAALIACWNATMIIYFIPGQPRIGELVAILSLFIAIVTRTLNKESNFIRVPALNAPLFFLMVVVFITAELTGGLGARQLGAETWGAKRYIGLFTAMLSYYAFTASRLPQENAKWLASLFFLGGVTAFVSDLAYAAGSNFYWLFAFFPADIAAHQAFTETTLKRFSGLSWAAIAALNFLLVRYGITGVFDLKKLWRILLLIACGLVSMLGGYRSSVLVFAITFTVQFFYEGLFRSKLFPAILFGSLITGVFVVAFTDQLPLSMQRSLSFLPLDIDPMARHDAAGTLDWRLQMWKTVVKDVPTYLLLGKGFSFNSTDYYLTEEATKRGFYGAFESTLVTGNYHNGILTIIIPFGIWGIIGFTWFCIAAIRILYANFRNSSAKLQTINCFLLSYFVARLLYYIFFYGQFDLDLMVFTSVVGLSVTINHGVLITRTEEPEEKGEFTPDTPLLMPPPLPSFNRISRGA